MNQESRVAIRNSLWESLLKQCDNKCYYCGRKGKLEKEHFIPLARGGSAGIDNIVPACSECNRLKGTSTGLEFLKWMDFLYPVGLYTKPNEFCRECGFVVNSHVMSCTCESPNRGIDRIPNFGRSMAD